MEAFDLVVRGGTVATAGETFRADIGIRGETVAHIGIDLARGKQEIDARGKLVLPGGVDPHAHIEQLSASGLTTADDFQSATLAAAFGGTTSVICFAAQHIGMDLAAVVADYHVRAERGAIIDYGFHMIISEPTANLARQIPQLVKDGHASLKVYMTYERLKLDEEALLSVLTLARENGAMVCVHAENHGIISWLSKRLIARGYTHTKYHAVARSRAAEVEAFHRIIAMAALVDQPIMIFHVTSAEAIAVIRDARARGLKIFGETCPQYLLLTEEALDRPGSEGAKYLCSPPPRTKADQDALWMALRHGELQVVSSDHSPYAYDATGKLKHGPDPPFTQIPGGMPGIETRLPLMFDAMVSQGRLDLSAFVRLTATEPAKIYGLYPRKGTIAVGSDADLVIWNPEAETRIHAAALHDKTGYTPFEGMLVKGWPETVTVRGRVVIDKGKCQAEPGSGVFLARQGGPYAKPRGRASADFELADRLGARLG